MERFLLHAPEQPEMKLLHSIYAKMALDKAIRDFRTEQLLKEIDCALQDRNKENFLQLTGELKNILG
jgi:uncharacterized protein YpiB (UPF0302 family)